MRLILGRQTLYRGLNWASHIYCLHGLKTTSLSHGYVFERPLGVWKANRTHILRTKEGVRSL